MNKCSLLCIGEQWAEKYVFFMKECGSNVEQFNLLQAHQVSAKTLQKCNLTLNKMHDLTENRIRPFYGRRREQCQTN